MRAIHGVRVYGVEVGPKTECLHYKSDLDIIAVRFKCCGRFYPCIACHDEVAGHHAERWTTDDRDVKIILCGSCGHQLTLPEYLATKFLCPSCQSAFNPGCASHLHQYLEVAEGTTTDAALESFLE